MEITEGLNIVFVLDEVPVWQNTSRREGDSQATSVYSQATSVWDLQPAAEVCDEQSSL